jgi:hypothetical protein
LNHFLEVAFCIFPHVEPMPNGRAAADRFASLTLLVYGCFHPLLGCINLELGEPALHCDHQNPGWIILIARAVEEADVNACPPPHVDCDDTVFHRAEYTINFRGDDVVTVIDSILQSTAGGPGAEVHSAADSGVNEAVAPFQIRMLGLQPIIMLTAHCPLSIQA